MMNNEETNRVNTCCKDANVEREVELKEQIEIGMEKNKMELMDSSNKEKTKKKHWTIYNALVRCIRRATFEGARKRWKPINTL